MDSDLPSPNQESNETKAEFRKLTNEAAHRKYRRHSPMAGSSDEDGSPKHDHSSRVNPKSDERRMDDKVDDRHSSRSQHGRSGDSYRHSSRSNRHDDLSRYGKHADEDDRSRIKSSSQSSREPRSGTYTDSRGRDTDYNRPRDRYRDVDKYSRDKSDASIRKYRGNSSSDRTSYDGRHGSRYDDYDRYARDRGHRDESSYHRSSKDHKSDRPSSFEDPVGSRTKWGSASAKDSDKNDQLDRDEDGINRGGIKADDKSACVSEELAAKRPKFFSSEDTYTRKDETSDSKVMPEKTAVNGSDSASNVDAAKVAAIKAAELVNKNLTSTGLMTADQKKKLLWGNKKSTPTDESSHRWDSAMFSDRERQEKFNKLMGVKGEVKASSKSPSGQDAEKQKELQLDLEKQYTAGLRRRDGRTVGLGL